MQSNRHPTSTWHNYSILDANDRRTLHRDQHRPSGVLSEERKREAIATMVEFERRTAILVTAIQNLLYHVSTSLSSLTSLRIMEYCLRIVEQQHLSKTDIFHGCFYDEYPLVSHVFRDGMRINPDDIDARNISGEVLRYLLEIPMGEKTIRAFYMAKGSSSSDPAASGTHLTLALEKLSQNSPVHQNNDITTYGMLRVN